MSHLPKTEHLTVKTLNEGRVRCRREKWTILESHKTQIIPTSETQFTQ